ncbi:LPXTG-motif cell wall-anchored protein [Gracilibacillus halotolerans]|uniref:LPXTG-motif cell wall-anchored protein n=1 Tax=Gracilibacillus halotolerans TaxID=74386 RepID=A0A841RHW9_9BACI|nr:carbohydrate binding domain-containing protein [Gracilibacillus halotolerans]MBB6512079.1 LPXTG-motif cell wall-anchored protein [Gracilibacillus halotolerans]
MFKKSLSMFLVILLICTHYSTTVLANPQDESVEVGDSFGDWTLVWHDEFDGNELNEENWRIDTGNGFIDGNGEFIHGWGNEELQYYQEDNVSVEDGYLVLEAKEETVHYPDHGRETFHYTSGKVISDGGRFNKKYGRFEARMSLPKGQGFWPAFWMMPANDEYGAWAASGEIDIMENAGNSPNKIGGAIHYGGEWPNNTFTAKDYYFPEGRDITDFNVYAVEWEPGEIRWYVNDELYQTVNNWDTTGNGNPAKFTYPAPFDQEFHIILNLAIGGHYGGNPDETTEFPNKVLVDYVRVYDLTGREYREPVEPTFEGAPLPENAKEAVEGNYIYDTGFEQGFTEIRTDAEAETNWNRNYWNFLHLEQFNGSGSVSVDSIDDKPFAKVEIENGGNQSHSIQLIQDVTVTTGRWYKLSFDAKSTTNRPMNVKIGGGAERGWSAYSPNRDYELTDETQSYEMTFQMQQESDASARLEFNVGNNANPVWIGNVRLEEVEPVDPYNEDGPKTPLADGNHIYNGTFDLGRLDRLTYWDFLTDGAEANVSVQPEARELNVSISNGGSEKEAIQIKQRGIQLRERDEYQLTFEARAEEARDIDVAFVSEDGENVYVAETFSLSTTMEQHEMLVTMDAPTDIESQLVFMLGGNGNDVTIDNVRLVRLTDHHAGVSLEDAFPLKNGNFTHSLLHWTSHVQGEHEPGISEATFEITDGELVSTVTNAGWEPWHVMLEQSNLDLKEGNTYILEFDAKSSINREIEIAVENSSYERYFHTVIELTEEMSTYSFEIDMGTNDAVALKFLLGNSDADEHSFHFDNVKLEVKGEREKYFPLENGDFSKELEEWNPHVQGDHEPDVSEATFDVVDGELKASIINAGWEPWHVLIDQGNLNLRADNTYILTFDAKSSVDRDIEVVVENSSYHRYFHSAIELTDTMQTFSYEFEMDADDIGALKFLLGNTDIGEHEVYLDNVRLEVKGAREVLEEETVEGEEPTPPGNEEEDPDDSENDEDNELEERISQLEQLIDELTSKIEQLESHSDLLELEKRIQGLEEQLAELRKEYSHVEESFTLLEQELSDLKREMELLKEQYNNEEDKREENPSSDDSNQESGDNSDEVESPERDSKAENSQETTDKDEHILPDTATNQFNYLLIGLLFIVASGILLYFRKKRV